MTLKRISNPRVLPTEEELEAADDASTLTSSPLTRTTSSNSTKLDSAPKARTSARQKSPRKPPPSSAHLEIQATRSAVVWFILAVSLFIAAVWHQPPKTSLVWPTANSTDGIIARHSNWKEVHEYEHLLQAIKNYETTITHMRAIIKHSSMRNRRSLEEQMQVFSADTDKVISQLVSWDSLAQAAVEEIQNLSDFAENSTPGWTSDLKHDKRKNKQLRKLLSKESRKIGGRLNLLKEKRPSLLDGLGTVGMHLQIIAELLWDEEARLDPKDKAFAQRVYPLHKMTKVVMDGHRMINNLQVTVKKSGRGLGRLRQAIWGIDDKTSCETEQMSLCLSNIQNAVDRLGVVWKPSNYTRQSQNTKSGHRK